MESFEVEPGWRGTEACVGGGGRPGIFRGLGNDAGADRVEVDVREGGEKVRGLEDPGIEAALPKPAAAIEPTVEILGILAGEMLHEPADSLLRLAGNDQVNVVRHEGVAMDEDLAQIGVVVQKGEQFGAVLVAA